jgi:hypothetical protein
LYGRGITGNDYLSRRRAEEMFMMRKSFYWMVRSVIVPIPSLPPGAQAPGSSATPSEEG